MERIDSFNCQENLVAMYVFHLAYRKVSTNPKWQPKYTMESAPFIHREVCSGAMHCNISDLKLKGFDITSYYIEKVMVPDTEN